MGKLIYASNMSLDGCTEDAQGALDWAPPDDDVFVAITDVMASVGTYLYGRRMYDAMAVWETDPSLGERSALTANYASVWGAADKIVYSTTLADVATERTQLQRSFDCEAVRELVTRSPRDVLVGGPHLAAQALRSGIVDEVLLYVWPVILGGGNLALPTDLHADLELVHEHRFDNGVVHLRYRVAPTASSRSSSSSSAGE